MPNKYLEQKREQKLYEEMKADVTDRREVRKETRDATLAYDRLFE